jgi:hypothetical protein
MHNNIDGYIGSGTPAPASNDLQMELMQALDMSSLLGQAVDAAQTSHSESTIGAFPKIFQSLPAVR